MTEQSVFVIRSEDDLAQLLCIAGWHVHETHNGREVGPDWVCHHHRAQARKHWGRLKYHVESKAATPSSKKVTG